MRDLKSRDLMGILLVIWVCLAGQSVADDTAVNKSEDIVVDRSADPTPVLGANSDKTKHADLVDVMVVVGAEGAPEYAEPFTKAAALWQESCKRAELNLIQIENKTAVTQHDVLRDQFAKLSAKKTSRPLWLVLIGHGTWDGKSAKFNLIGPDVDARTLANWIKPIDRPLVILNGASCSGPFVDRLSGDHRVVVTATKSGSEQNATRFSTYMAKAIGNVAADLDHDDEVSVREAYLKAVSDLEAFYREQGRLASEHALLDDNGDRKGSNYKMLRGITSVKPGDVIDGKLAAKISIPSTVSPLQLTETQLKERTELEEQLETLKKTLADDREELRKQAVVVLEKLAAIYADAEKDAAEAKQ